MLRQKIVAILTLACLLPGCSYIVIRHSPSRSKIQTPQEKQRRSKICKNNLDSNAAPWLDAVLSVIGGLLTVVTINSKDDNDTDNSPKDFDFIGPAVAKASTIIGGLVIVAIHAPSAVYGFVERSRCSDLDRIDNLNLETVTPDSL